jgi:hypothetical protein
MLCIIGMDFDIISNCQVNTMSHLYNTLVLTVHDFKTWISFLIVSTHSTVFNRGNADALHLILITYLVFYLLVFSRCLAVDCSSHVCLDLHLRSTIIFAELILIGASSIAIWNRKKVIVAMAITLWGINVAFLIEGRSLPLYCMSYAIYKRCFLNRCRQGVS